MPGPPDVNSGRSFRVRVNLSYPIVICSIIIILPSTLFLFPRIGALDFSHQPSHHVSGNTVPTRRVNSIVDHLFTVLENSRTA